MTSAQPKPDPRPHRTAFYEVDDLAGSLCGDVVLVPDADNIDGITRDDLTKISHWSNMTKADIPRLAVLTDSFLRFIDEGQDASIVTLWRDGTPLVQQIDGEPCAAALDLIQDAIAGQTDIREKWHGLPQLEAEIEKLAYHSGFGADHRPKWLERKARENLAARGIEPDEPKPAPQPANDNAPRALLERIRRIYGGEIIGEKVYRAKIAPGTPAAAIIGLLDGEPWVFTPKGEPFSKLPSPPAPIRATPFALRDPASLPERDWLFGRHYIRRYLTATVGAGGGGKSAHATSEVLAMVTGRPLLDPDGPLTKPLRVWFVNAEDPQEEIDRRFHAAAKHFGVTAEQIGGRLFTDSGRDQEFVIMRQEGRDLKVCQPLIDEMVAEIGRREIDVIIIDPLVSTHEVQENDNGAMQRVAKAWTEVADRANCSVEVIHHVVKNAGEVTADSARGGGALKDKTRSMRVLNPMTQAEADKVGLDAPDGYFRIDHGKVNLVASGRSQWRRMVSVPLGNGRGLLKTGDEIGVVESWRWPSQDVLAERAAEARASVVGEVPAETLAGIKVRLGAADHKSSEQAKSWAGLVVAEILGLDPKADRDSIKEMLAAWVEMGELEVVDLPDHRRHLTPHIKPCAT